MNLYYAVYNLPTHTDSAIISEHPLSFQHRSRAQGQDVITLWWKELTHDEIMDLVQDGLEDAVLYEYLEEVQENEVICGECSAICVETDGKDIYPHRKDLYDLKFFKCLRCLARCGAHKETGKPLGTPVGPDARKARQKAHGVFDRLWKDGGPFTRANAYLWLQRAMEMTADECHIGRMTQDQAEKVVELAERHLQSVKQGDWPDEMEIEDGIPF